MERKMVSGLLVLFVLTGQAQTNLTLVDEGKLWSTVHYYATPWNPVSDYTKFEGDTTIAGLTYLKVWRSLDEAHLSWQPNGYIREDDGQVFYLSWWGGPANNLIYDFNAETGDTLWLFYDPMGDFMTVTSMDSILLLTGESRKQIHLVCHGASGDSLGQDQWVEGIGSLLGVLQSGSCMLVGDNPRLLCFHENDSLKYQDPGYADCFVVTGMEPGAGITARVECYPNPAKGSVSINVADPSLLPSHLIIMDPVGRVILERPLIQATTILDLGKMPECVVMYYSIKARDGSFVSGKLITQP